MTKPISWFEIPARDLSRAQTFYEKTLGVEMTRHNMTGIALAIFPYERDKATGGAVAQGQGLEPSANGVVIYLDAPGGVAAVAQRAAANGGQIVMPPTELPNSIGWIAQILDTEGNRVGLHAQTR